MKIEHNKKSYELGEINKEQFINQMFKLHEVLFDFAKNLKNTEIGKIEIEEGSVIFTTKKNSFTEYGCKFEIDFFDKRVSPIESFNFNAYENADSKMIDQLLNDGDIIFDIGANIGWYSIHLSRKLENSMIYSFEPILETYLSLSKNVKLNNLNNIILNNIAISDYDGYLDFYYDKSSTGSSSIENLYEKEDIDKVICKSVRLDSFVMTNQIDNLDFIKCDVEGAELLVFKGAKFVIDKFKPIVFTEMLRKWTKKFGYHPNQIIDFFKDLNYRCYFVENLNLVEINEITDQTIQTNFFFLHKIKHKDIIQSVNF